MTPEEVKQWVEDCEFVKERVEKMEELFYSRGFVRPNVLRRRAGWEVTLRFQHGTVHFSHDVTLPIEFICLSDDEMLKEVETLVEKVKELRDKHAEKQYRQRQEAKLKELKANRERIDKIIEELEEELSEDDKGGAAPEPQGTEKDGS